jgi:ABC-2 type transport system permease protein
MTKALGSFFRQYLPFTRSIIQRYMSYRLNFFLFFFGNFLRAFVTYYIWQAVFIASGNTEGTLEGFSLETMTIYVFLSIIVQEVTHSESDHTIADEVVSGKIAVNLVRPINYHIRLLFEGLGTALYHCLFLGIPIWITLQSVIWFQYGIGIPSLITLGFFVSSLLLSFLLIFFLNMSFGFLAFYTTKIWGLRNVKFIVVDFFSGAIIPLSFFPSWGQELMDWLPFKSMLYHPMLIYLGKLEEMEGISLWQSLGTQAFWVLVLGAVSWLVWRSSVKRLTILGG